MCVIRWTDHALEVIALPSFGPRWPLRPACGPLRWSARTRHGFPGPSNYAPRRVASAFASVGASLALGRSDAGTADDQAHPVAASAVRSGTRPAAIAISAADTGRVRRGISPVAGWVGMVRCACRLPIRVRRGLVRRIGGQGLRVQFPWCRSIDSRNRTARSPPRSDLGVRPIRPPQCAGCRVKSDSSAWDAGARRTPGARLAGADRLADG